MCLTLFVGVCVGLFCNALFCVLSSFAIILTRKRELCFSCLPRMSCEYSWSVVPRGAVGWSAVCDFGIS